MKYIVIIAAVVLICQSAKVPQEITHQISAPVSSNVLVPPGSLKDSAPEPVQVVEVVKDQNSVAEEKSGETVMPPAVETKRKTRAVLTTKQPEVKAVKPTVNDMNTARKVDTKTVLLMPDVEAMTEMKRKTRAVTATVQPKVKAEQHVVVQVTTVQTTTIQPEIKSVMSSVSDMKRKTRAVTNTVQSEVKSSKTAVVVPEDGVKSAADPSKQTETKAVTPTVTEMKRQTRAAVTTAQPEVQKNIKPTVEVSPVNVKTVVTSTMQQTQTKTVMPTVTGMKRQKRAVRTTVQPKEHVTAKKMPQHRSMRSVKVETTTNAPVNTVAAATVVKTSHPPSTKSAIDACDLLCTKFEFEPICASNGLCLHEFPNQCILDTFNCKHPKAKFTATKDGSCQMSWLAKCKESDMI